MANTAISYLDPNSIICFNHISRVHESERVVVNILPVRAAGQNPTRDIWSFKGATGNGDSAADSEGQCAQLKGWTNFDSEFERKFERRS